MTIQQFTRIMGQVEKTTTCWLWQGVLKYGRSKNLLYGQVSLNGRALKPHKVIYEILRGPIPDGLELDHVCRITICVNPDHLEPVTHRENLRRMSEALNGHCRRGHDMNTVGIYVNPRGTKECRECLRMRNERRRK